jgi:hypothetical protein
MMGTKLRNTELALTSIVSRSKNPFPISMLDTIHRIKVQKYVRSIIHAMPCHDMYVKIT